MLKESGRTSATSAIKQFKNTNFKYINFSVSQRGKLIDVIRNIIHSL